MEWLAREDQQDSSTARAKFAAAIADREMRITPTAPTRGLRPCLRLGSPKPHPFPMSQRKDGKNSNAISTIPPISHSNEELLQHTVIMRFRKILLLCLTPLWLFAAGYCVTAGSASGGWRLNREGEPSYSAPVHYSRDFYTGLRWSVVIVGGTMAITSYYCRHRTLTLVFTSVAVLFNPIISIHMSKDAWEVIDLLVFWVFLIGPGYLWPKTDDD
jgi:Family of unknown function (DUF6804)